MYDIFLSYVHANEGKVRKLYEDLTRSGVSVWEFRSRMEYDEDFIEEFKRQILNSSVFCLIDSNESRKGYYVGVEVAFALENKKKITICRIEEIIEEPPLPVFKQQNFIIRFELWGKKYAQAMRDLCNHLGKTYTPLFSEPIDKDFLEELGIIQMKETGIETKEWKEFLQEYEAFREAGEENTEWSILHLKKLLGQAKKLNIRLITPYLVLGDVYARQQKHCQAKEVYKEALCYFESDPRVYAGLGGAYYFLTEFRESVTAYAKCFDLLLKTTEENHREHVVEIAHNLLQAMLEGSLKDDFIARINRIPGELGYVPQIDVLRGKYYLYCNRYTVAIIHFEKAYKQLRLSDIGTAAEASYISVLILDLAMAYGYSKDYWLRREILEEGIYLLENDWAHFRNTSLGQLLAEMLGLLGETFLKGFHNEKAAIDYYKKASVTGNNLKFHSQLALVCCKLSSPYAREALEKAEALRKKISNASPEEKYYTGLYYFLRGKTEVAEEYYNDSERKDWPYYNELM